MERIEIFEQLLDEFRQIVGFVGRVGPPGEALEGLVEDFLETHREAREELDAMRAEVEGDAPAAEVDEDAPPEDAPGTPVRRDRGASATEL